MKKVIFPIILILAVCSFAFAQSVFPELNKAREIKLLQSNRKDVKRILKGFEYDKDENDDYTQTFSTENADIEITFSKGKTCGDEDSETVWNVGEWKVIRIEISPNMPLRFENLGIDVSSFRKEQYYANVKDLFVYHNKDLGIAFEVDEKDVVENDETDFSEDGEENVVEEEEEKEIEEDNIETIYIFPPNGTQSLLCDNEETEEFKAFYKNDSFFTETDLEKRVEAIGSCGPPSVTSLTLSTNEIAGCSDSAEGSCSDISREISVKTNEKNLQNDPITYHYVVSGGKVVGNGAEVVWDLTGVEPGTYTITAGVNDGCGICGETKTETVIVKECNDCVKKQPQTDAEKPTNDPKKP